MQKLFIEIAHWPQKVSHYAAVNEGRQDILQLAERIPNTLEPVYNKEQNDAQAHSAENGQHQIKIPPFVGILHFYHPRKSFMESIPAFSLSSMNKL